MPTVILSDDFEIVIPEELRQKFDLKPGDKLDVYDRDQSLRISKHRPITELRGIAKGLQGDDYRDRHDRF